jgi:hypothetical protein
VHLDRPPRDGAPQRRPDSSAVTGALPHLEVTDNPMNTIRRTGGIIALLAGAGLVAALGASPLLVAGADHLDAPTAKSDARIDITDIYAFASKGGTSLVLNVNPLTSPADTGNARFSHSALYQFNVDTNLDARADVAYRIKFSKPWRNRDGNIVQCYTVKRATGSQARRNQFSGDVVAHGMTTAYGASTKVAGVRGGGKVFAGPRDDPFFFDLPGFVEFKTQLLAGSTDLDVLLGGFTGADTFAGTNNSSIVLELPNKRLGGSDATVGVWATTSNKVKGKYVQVERMGRPAINTVFNHTDADKEAANRRSPAGDRAADRERVVGVLQAIDNVLETNGAPSYDDPTIEATADVLLPDTLTVKLGDTSGFLNGRRLADDVIDAEFGLLTNGNVTSDGVDANDKAFKSSFPYLAAPH